METLSRFAQRAGAAVVLAALVGCVSRPAEVPEEPRVYWRGAAVQSIPANAWIEQNGDAVGIAPMVVWVETYESGVPKAPVILRGHDRLTGAWEQKMYATVAFPARILFDLRPWMTAEQLAGR